MIGTDNDDNSIIKNEPAVQDFLQCKMEIEEDEEIDADADNVPQLSEEVVDTNLQQL